MLGLGGDGGGGSDDDDDDDDNDDDVQVKKCVKALKHMSQKTATKEKYCG
jgi:hypothetical protein